MSILTSVMYHYVRNPERTRYKGIHAVRETAFVQQVKHLKSTFEMATAASVVDFLNGKYLPKKELCVLTFDDGLKEHAKFVTTVLQEHNIQGLFFIPTACVEEAFVLPVHKNHFLLAYLPFKTYREQFTIKLKEQYPKIDIKVKPEAVKATYRWDTFEVASFKYLLNYKLEKVVRNTILSEVFEETFGKESDFADELYLNWEEAKAMQNAGMLLGGHSHRHNVLASLPDKVQESELQACMSLLKTKCLYQEFWPFSYPFGKLDTFNQYTLNLLKKYQINFAFTSVVGHSEPNEDPYYLKRIDPKDLS